jgi:hypothetical protein
MVNSGISRSLHHGVVIRLLSSRRDIPYLDPLLSLSLGTLNIEGFMFTLSPSLGTLGLR